MVTRIRRDRCILCLTGSKNIQSISSTDNDSILVEEKLKYIFPEFINFKPGKPANICTDCLKELNNVCEFKQKCSQNLIFYMNDIIFEYKECNNYKLTATNTQCEFTLQNHKSANAPESNAKVKDEIQETTLKDNFTIKLEKQDIHEDTDVHCHTLSLQNHKSANAPESNAKVKDEIQETTLEDNFTIKLEKQDIHEDTDVQCHTLFFDEVNSESIAKYESEDDDSGAFVNDVNDETDVKSDPLLPENTVNLVDILQNGTTNNTEHIPPSIATGEKKLLHKCCKCRTIFSQKQDITTHICSKTKTYDCEVCDTPFSTEELLKKHLRSHKSKQTYICSLCGKICTSRYYFIAHKRIHTGYKPHQCKQCGKGFNQKCHLLSHTRFHKKSTPHLCFICERAFNTEGELIRHNRSHPEEVPCRCDICGVRFRSRNQMQRHKHVHYDKKFKCEVCNKVSLNQINYDKHKLLHSREKLFKCDKCDAALSTLRQLANHKKMHFKKIINVAAST